MNPAVSIIIPTYNRAHLIGETLDSVLAQTYNNWECIVVDDGSTDNTVSLLQKYCEKDARIQFHPRPKDRPKGANACRNYGFELIKGEYVNWFDSDDIMDPQKLELTVSKIIEGNWDMVISRSKYYDSNKFYQNNFKEKDISLENFVLQKINWLTPDALINVNIIRNISFNESLKSSQEYNFFARVLCVAKNIKLIDFSTTFYRVHDYSIQGNLRSDLNKSYLNYYKSFFITYLEVKNHLSHNTSINLLNRIKFYVYNLNFESIIKMELKWKFIYNLILTYGIKKTIFYISSIGLKKTLNVGYKLYILSK